MDLLIAWLLYGALWAGFGIVHSFLARPKGRRLLGQMAGQRHRLAYNGLALVHFGSIWLIGRWAFADHLTPFLPFPLQVIGYLLAALGGVGLLMAFRRYDSGLFLGSTPTPADGSQADAEPLVTSGLNAQMRHPLYATALLAVWALSHTPFALATAAYATAYILIGIRLEEAKLAARYGDAYRHYQQTVPMLIPKLGG